MRPGSCQQRSPLHSQAAVVDRQYLVRPGIWAAFEVSMKTRGEIKAAICNGISRFEQDYMGPGPKDIHAYLIGDLLVVRLQGVLTES